MEQEAKVLEELHLDDGASRKKDRDDASGIVDEVGGAQKKTMNPMENPLIISKVFNNLEMKDKKRFRLVSKLWIDTTIEKWRKSVYVLVTEDDCLGHQKFEDFLEICAGGKNEAYRIAEFPFQNVRVVGDRIEIPGWENPFGDPRSRSATLFRQFWEVCAPALRYLRMDDWKFFCNGGFNSGMTWILGQCSELDELILDDCTFEILNKSSAGPSREPGNSEGAESKLRSIALIDIQTCENRVKQKIGLNDFRNLFELVPNIKSLTCNYPEAFDALTSLNIRAGTNVIKLEEIGSGADPKMCPQADIFYPSVLKYLKNARPSLKSIQFWLDLNAIRYAPYSFHQILRDWTKTLTKMDLRVEVEMPVHEWFTDLTGRNFPVLKILHLKFEWTRGRVINFDFRALCGMLQLRKLVCWARGELKNKLSEDGLCYNGRVEWMGIDSVEDWSNLVLEDLSEFEFQMPEKLGVAALTKLGKVMKNLKKLALKVEEESFEAVQQVWPNLEQFTLIVVGDEEEELQQRLVRNYTGSTRMIVRKIDYKKEFCLREKYWVK